MTQYNNYNIPYSMLQAEMIFYCKVALIVMSTSRIKYVNMLLCTPVFKTDIIVTNLRKQYQRNLFHFLMC